MASRTYAFGVSFCFALRLMCDSGVCGVALMTPATWPRSLGSVVNSATSRIVGGRDVAGSIADRTPKPSPRFSATYVTFANSSDVRIVRTPASRSAPSSRANSASCVSPAGW